MTYSILFFGSADFAVPALELLVAQGNRVLRVITQPDKPSGRGMAVSASPVKRTAERLGLEILQPKRVKSPTFLPKIADLHPDFLVVAAFGQIIPQSVLDLPKFAPVNIHGSLLPRWRGAAPIQRSVMAGDAETGVATMLMEASLDTGDILEIRSIPIGIEDTAGTLFPKLAELGAELLPSTLDGVANGTLTSIKQDDALATYANKILPEDSAIDWNETAQQIDWRIRGLLPKPGAFTQVGGRRVKLWRVSPLAEQTNELPGTVIGLSKEYSGVRVAAGNGTVALIAEAQPENGKRMDALSWARGIRIEIGTIFQPFVASV